MAKNSEEKDLIQSSCRSGKCDIDILKSRYLRGEESSWQDTCSAVADAVAKNEQDRKNYEEIMGRMDFVPGGRILRNARKGSSAKYLTNCVSLGIDDSIEEIAETIKDAMIVSASGGGIGIDFSSIRPKGAVIKTKGGTTTGVLSWMKIINEVGNVIETGGSRRAALLAGLSIRHPEVLDFIKAKTQSKQLENFNISVIVNEDFLEAVTEDLDWDLEFGGIKSQTLKARVLWDQILESMLSSAEPGLLNYDNIKNNNTYYEITHYFVNACAEIILERNGTCILGSLVLPNFVSSEGRTSWSHLKDVIHTSVKFLDDVIDTTVYPLQKLRLATEKTRRIGLGVMGLADYLFAKKVRYGSEASLRVIERLYKFIRDEAYKASIQLSKERGPFPLFKSSEYTKALFIRTLPVKIRSEIKKYGIRAATILSCPPTGTTSLMAKCTPGIEALFCKGFLRKDRISTRYYIHSIYNDCMVNKQDLPDWYVDAYDVTPEEHLEVNVCIQKFIDNNLSKTINLPEKTQVKDLSKLLLEYIWDLKGITVYRDKSRKDQVIYPLSNQEVNQLIKDKKQFTVIG